MLVKRPKISEKTTFDDYLEEKEKNSKNTIPPPTAAFEGNKNDAQQSMTAPAAVVPSAGQPVPRDKGQAVIMDDEPVAELPSKTVIPHDPAVGGGNGGEGNKGGVPETPSDTLERLTGDAKQHMLDVLGKEFKYNSKSSPLYGILREQYEREAERASGRAYARATANAGGYGSSYATLAGEEAARQVMEGFDDIQMALYEAARDEFYSEQQSAVERYQLLDQMYKEQKALEEEEAAELARSAAGGLTDTQYEAYTAAAQVWNGENKESVRAQLSRMPGMTAADVEAVMNALEADDGAVLADNVNSFKNAPTLSGAASILAAAKGRDNEAEITAEVQGSMKDAFTAALEDPTSAEVFSLLGMTEEQAAEKFGGITDPDELASAKKAYVLDAAGQARKAGLLSGDDYMNILKNDVGADLKVINDTDDEVKDPLAAVSDVVIGMQNYRDAGYLSNDEYNQMLDEIIAKTATRDLVARELDEKILNEDGFFEARIEAYAPASIGGGLVAGSLAIPLIGPILAIPGALLAIGGVANGVGQGILRHIEHLAGGDMVEKIDEFSMSLEGANGADEAEGKNLLALGGIGLLTQIPGVDCAILDKITGSEERTAALSELGRRAYENCPEEKKQFVTNMTFGILGGK